MRRPSVLEGKDERTLKGVAVVTRDQGPTLPFASNKTKQFILKYSKEITERELNSVSLWSEITHFS